MSEKLLVGIGPLYLDMNSMLEEAEKAYTTAKLFRTMTYDESWYEFDLLTAADYYDYAERLTDAAVQMMYANVWEMGWDRVEMMA